MPSPFWAILKEWQTFYVIVGGAAATLVGLMFIATSLASDAIIATAGESTRLYVTPTLIYFTAVLVTAASMVVPAFTQTLIGSLTLILGVCGLIFWTFILRRTKSTSTDDWIWGDWIFHVAAPLMSFAVFTIVGLMLLSGNIDGLDILPVAMILLLVSGIRNSWDMALWLATHR